ncbi:uncharacterized protein [Typha latifolia]|uniref:uncharacterized protein n=1 Tax=Typha latifolia TaxID=4733 RepID=UPI003C2D6680
MDPCPFVRLIVESLALKLPAVSRSPGNHTIHPSTTTPCFASLHLQDFPSLSQTAPLPLLPADPTTPDTASTSPPPVVISLDPAALRKLSAKPAALTVAVHSGRGGGTCGAGGGRVLGRVRVWVDVGRAAAEEEAVVAQSGWVGLGKGKGRLHLVVRAEPDPRFVFQFGGEPELSPVVYQIRGSGCVRQPVFSCRFNADRRRTTRSRSLPSNSASISTNPIKSWLGSFRADGDYYNPRHSQRKGWTVTIHDLSGSPIAAASMVTPFVPSPGSGRVSRANPGAWLILRAVGSSTASWKPWGRLEAWRDRGPVDALGYRFELVTDAGLSDYRGFPIAESSLGVRRGGRFVIDKSDVAGFVMGSTVEGEGKVSKPTVEVGAQHVSCMADVALFVALSAAVDLSMDACKLFSQKLRKELCVDQQE